MSRVVLRDRGRAWHRKNHASAPVARIALEAMGARMACVLLIGVNEASDRRLVRGTAQNQKWIDGRRTKARNFHDRFPRASYQLSASLGADKLLSMLQEIIRER